MLRLKGLPGLAMEAAKTIEGYAKLVLPMLPRDIEDMAPGEGFVGQKGLHKVEHLLHGRLRCLAKGKRTQAYHKVWSNAPMRDIISLTEHVIILYFYEYFGYIV
jgi:hypothetical protein